MLKFTFLSVAFLAAAVNFPAAHANPMNSAVTMGPKPEPAITDNSEFSGVINAFKDSKGKRFRNVILLSLGVCQQLPGLSAEVTWKENPNSYRGQSH